MSKSSDSGQVPRNVHYINETNEKRQNVSDDNSGLSLNFTQEQLANFLEFVKTNRSKTYTSQASESKDMGISREELDAKLKTLDSQQREFLAVIRADLAEYKSNNAQLLSKVESTDARLNGLQEGLSGRIEGAVTAINSMQSSTNTFHEAIKLQVEGFKFLITTSLTILGIIIAGFSIYQAYQQNKQEEALTTFGSSINDAVKKFSGSASFELKDQNPDSKDPKQPPTSAPQNDK